MTSQQALQDGLETASLYYTSGVVYQRRGMRDLARSAYAHALELEPGHADARENLDALS